MLYGGAAVGGEGTPPGVQPFERLGVGVVGSGWWWGCQVLLVVGVSRGCGLGLRLCRVLAVWDSCCVFCLWHAVHTAWRLFGWLVPPVARFCLWSISVAVVVQPGWLSWQVWLSRWRVVLRSFCHWRVGSRFGVWLFHAIDVHPFLCLFNCCFALVLIKCYVLCCWLHLCWLCVCALRVLLLVASMYRACQRSW